MSTATEVKDFLSILKDLDTASKFIVFIPSLQRAITFKQLTTEQLKRILKTVVDSPIYNTEFTLTFNEIIKENCLDTDVAVNKLTIYDKLFILFKTRIESVSPDYSFNFTKEEVNEYELKEKQITHSLVEQFESFVEKQYNFCEEIFEQGNCSVTCNLPTLDTENKLEKELHRNIKIDVESTDELRNIVGETFINELTKYITSVTINGSQSIELTSLDFKTRVKIVEQLPTIVVNNVIKYIERYRNSTKTLLNCTVKTVNKQGNTVSLDKELPVDASLFNI